MHPPKKNSEICERVFPTMMFSLIGSRHPLLPRFHPSLCLHEKRRTPFPPLNLSQKWPRTRKMTFFKAPAVLSRWNGNRQEPETPSNPPTSLHCCSSVRGEPCRPSPGAHTPFRRRDFDESFFNVNANIQRRRHCTRWDNVVWQLMLYHVV